MSSRRFRVAVDSSPERVRSQASVWSRVRSGTLSARSPNPAHGAHQLSPPADPEPAPAPPVPVSEHVAPVPPPPAPEPVVAAPAPPPPIPVAPIPVPVLPVALEAPPGGAGGTESPHAAEIKLGPFPAWEPPSKAIDAYLRVTWEHPPKEGPNDWVEDPHEEIVDAIFEAAAFARDVTLERFGFRALVGAPSERNRARAVMKVLHFNERLKDAIAWVEEQERAPAPPPRAERRRRRWRERPPEGNGHAPEAGPTPSTVNRRPAADRREVALRYLEGLDKMMNEGIPLETGVQLAALYAPMLLEALDVALARSKAPEEAFEHVPPGPRGMSNAELIIDDIMRPIALRHSLARRDRDRVKRIVLAARRLLRDGPNMPGGGGRRRRSRGGNRLIGKDYFQEALVLLWLHSRATGQGWDAFRFWQQRALVEKREHGAGPDDRAERGRWR